jgi:hypothetical protein
MTEIQEGKIMNTCDHGHDTKDEIRSLPISEGGGNALLCKKHFLAEMKYRREMVADGVWTNENTDFPTWESLKIYSEKEK